ncbi:MAG: TIM-barrel domain-containing protein [Ignavibacteriaceae bacterium]
MKLLRWLIIILLFSLIMCQDIFSYEKQDDGIILKINKQKDTDPRLIKIEICNDDIIRIIASPVDTFSTRTSLMVNKTAWRPIKWTVKKEGDLIKISTPNVIVTVDSTTGQIAFYNSDNHLLLEEKAGGGKIISPAEVMGEKTYHIRQLFEPSNDEAFYGLGQHQNGIMNYKEHDVDLWQYNIIAVNPFLISSKNYGILLDNNSRTKFGDIRDYQPISSLKLFDKDGVNTGLTAEYFRDTSFKNLDTSRDESRIEHKFIDVNDPYPEGFAQNVKAVRWSGEIECNKQGIHKFRLYACGYTKMWLNGKLVVDSWRQNWLPWTHILKLKMEQGKRYKIKIEWIHSGGYIGLDYLNPEDINIKDYTSLYSEVADQIDYYFIYGKNIDRVIHGYREITGQAPMMPKWAMGFWQCRERYKTQDELLSVVKEFRNRQIPIDNIVQDWFYWKEDQWGSHRFDSTRYPDPDAMVKELHDNLHTHIMISVWPKFYVGIKHYEEFKENGWLYMRNVEKGQKDWVGPGYVSTFYDPYSEGARNLYWKQINDNLFTKGFDAWWLDATEPDICSNLSREETRLRENPTALGTAARYLNTYSLMNSKAVYEGQRETNPDQRVFILTRSAFAGQQRYSAATWSGDIASRWEDLSNQIPAGLNFSLSGLPYWTTDIGGFAVEQRYENPDKANLAEWRELMTRWFQFGTFCPLFRVHGQYPYREIFNIAPEDHPAYKTMLAYDKLRYRLMPYIYSLTGMVTQNDYTIMRALVMDFGYDKNVLNIGDQFMFGPALLINPITKYKARKRNVYLPSGTGWYDIKSGKYFKGGETIEAEAPYSDIPIFVKEGSIIPCGPALQYSTEKQADPVRLFVYTGNDCSFNLYEDENTNYNYEKEMFSIIPIKYDGKNHEIFLGKRQGGFPGMLETRTFEIIWISKENPSGLKFNSKPGSVIKYDGTQQIIKMK